MQCCLKFFPTFTVSKHLCSLNVLGYNVQKNDDILQNLSQRWVFLIIKKPTKAKLEQIEGKNMIALFLPGSVVMSRPKSILVSVPLYCATSVNPPVSDLVKFLTVTAITFLCGSWSACNFLLLFITLSDPFPISVSSITDSSNLLGLNLVSGSATYLTRNTSSSWPPLGRTMFRIYSPPWSTRSGWPLSVECLELVVLLTFSPESFNDLICLHFHLKL